MADPSYDDLCVGRCDHTESLQLDYDPQEVSYEELLEIFWESHSPSRPVGCAQYMSAIFYHDKAQKKAAKSSKTAVEKKYGKPLHTKLLPAKGTFWVAEDYHQKFYLRRHNGGALLDMLGFTSEAELRDSPVATKLNAYVQNKGSLAQLQREMGSFNLSNEARDYLLDFVQRMEATKCKLQAA